MKRLDYDGLKNPFADSDIEWKPGSMTKDGTKAMAMAYVDARAVQDRLDNVCGPGGWQTSYTPIDGGFICALSIYDAELEMWVTKEDGAQQTQFEPLKGGISSSLRRAASAWGIGRYLYALDAQWVPCESYDSGGKKKFSKFKSKPSLNAPKGTHKPTPKAAPKAEIPEPSDDHTELMSTFQGQIESAKQMSSLTVTGKSINNSDLPDNMKDQLRGQFKIKKAEIEQS